MKWNRNVIASVLAIAVTAAVGCADDETGNATTNATTNNATTNNVTTNNVTTNNATTNATTNNTTTGPLNECEPYEPTPASGTEALMWPEQEAEVQFQITVPDDPGGGWVRLQAVTQNTDISPRIDVYYQETDGASIVAASGGGQDDPQTAIAYFEAAPGLTYEVVVDQFGNAPVDQYPVDFSVEWEFTSVVDCYEPNSTPADAKKIPFDVEIEAYTLAGYRENRFDNPSLSDWYEVTVDEEAIIDVDFTQVPPGDRMSIRIFDNPEEPRIGGGRGDVGTPFMASTGDPVPAGTYLIEVVTAASETRTSRFDEPLPGAWSTPYQFTVTSSL